MGAYTGMTLKSDNLLITPKILSLIAEIDATMKRVARSLESFGQL